MLYLFSTTLHPTVSLSRLLRLSIEELVRKDPSRQHLNLSSAAPTTPVPPVVASAPQPAAVAAASRDDASKRSRTDAAAADAPVPVPATERKRRRTGGGDAAEDDEFGPCPTPRVRPQQLHAFRHCDSFCQVRFTDIGGINAILEEIQQVHSCDEAPRCHRNLKLPCSWSNGL
jgi:hypothetical protein